MKKTTLIKLVVSLALVSDLTLQGAITIVNPGGANHIPSSICPAIDGNNHLNPDPATYLPPPVAGQGIMAELAAGDTAFPGWTFNVGGALNGTLTINYYLSIFVGTHFSGAAIKATYTPGVGDPATLRFVQMIDTSDPLNGATSPYVDPFPGDDPTNAPALPFYWTEKETAKYGLVFYDFSKRTHPPTSVVTWRGNLYITSWDGNNPGTVTVHDGVNWGFDAGCVEIELVSLSLTSLAQPNSLVLSWPSNSMGGRIETKFDLNDPGWTPVTNGAVLSNSHFNVSVPTPAPAQFFRVSVNNTGAPPSIQPAYLRVMPLAGTVEQGHEASLSVKADGTLPILYQWSVNGTPIPGGTERELRFAHVAFTNQGNYTVSVTNAAGGETSAPALLTIIQDTNQPTLISANASQNRLQIAVKFSEGVNPATAMNPGNYQIQRLSPPGTVAISSVSPTGDESVVVLNPASALTPNSGFQLMVFNVTDFATPPNTVPPGSITTFTTGP